MREKKQKTLFLLLGSLVFLVVAALGMYFFMVALQPSNTSDKIKDLQSKLEKKEPASSENEAETTYLQQKFADLKKVNAETIAYIYAPGTQLDEPVVQTSDNATYLDKTFEGGHEPYLGTVFMDMDNKKDFSDRLTWLFGHARGSQLADHRMFNDVNYYSEQSYFDQHPYVVIETAEKKHYYQAMAMIIVPEDTAFYKTSFKDDAEFEQQLTEVYQSAKIKNPAIQISAKDKYLVLSTCREEDPTIRSNLYLREIPDNELSDFLAKHASELNYVPTR